VAEPGRYPAPLDRIHALGLDETEQPATVDYRALGVGPEDVPALISIVTDRRYDTAMLPIAWAPLHAWRALGVLRAPEAAEPLTTLLDRAGDDDWILDDVPRALGLIGTPAIPLLARYLADRDRHHWGRVAAGVGLREIGQTHPDARDQCVAVLTDQLRLFATQDTELNAFLVAELLELRAVESAPVIEEAYAADRVELVITGDWEDAQVELGILPARLTPRPRYTPFPFDVRWRERPEPAPGPRAARERRAAEKRRRKLAKQSKRRNRRK
jgi:hypothetical protein